MNNPTGNTLSMATIEEVLGNFNAKNHVVLATVEGSQPRLRPVTLVKLEGEFYFSTGKDAKKVKQLEQNPEVEIILQWKDEQKNGYVRIEGTTVLEESIEIKTKLYHEFDYFSMLWKSPDDPDLIVYHVIPRVYDYMKSGEFASVLIEIK